MADTPDVTAMPVLEPPPPQLTLDAPPAGLAAAVATLHGIAEQVVAPARVAATGNEIALRWTPGGFGTPAFPDGGQVRVEGAELVTVSGGDGAEERAPLDVDAAASSWLGDFYGFAHAALERLIAGATAADAPTEVHLWPEHFDIAIELGDDGAGARANYGASPGDEHHPEPYFYVGPWTARPEGPLWNARGFPGAELALGELLAAGDQAGAVDAFFAERLAALRG